MRLATVCVGMLGLYPVVALKSVETRPGDMVLRLAFDNRR